MVAWPRTGQLKKGSRKSSVSLPWFSCVSNVPTATSPLCQERRRDTHVRILRESRDQYALTLLSGPALTSCGCLWHIWCPAVVAHFTYDCAHRGQPGYPPDTIVALLYHVQPVALCYVSGARPSIDDTMDIGMWQSIVDSVSKGSV